jgi:hypothetical protein
LGESVVGENRAVTETSPAADQGAQIKRLQQRVGALEWQQSQATVISALGAVLVSAAALLVVGLALPWMSVEGRAEFGSSSQSGWAAFVGEPVGLLVLLTWLVLIGLAVATAAGRSPRLHLATHIVADVVCLPPLVLLLSAMREGSSIVPRAGCYTMLIATLAIAVAAWVRRGRLENLK